MNQESPAIRHLAIANHGTPTRMCLSCRDQRSRFGLFFTLCAGVHCAFQLRYRSFTFSETRFLPRERDFLFQNIWGSIPGNLIGAQDPKGRTMVHQRSQTSRAHQRVAKTSGISTFLRSLASEKVKERLLEHDLLSGCGKYGCILFRNWWTVNASDLFLGKLAKSAWREIRKPAQ